MLNQSMLSQSMLSQSDTTGLAGGLAGGLVVESLAKASAWRLTAGLAAAAGQWGQMMALARLGPAEMVGRYALALSLASPLLLAANLQLRTVLVTDAAGRFSWRRCRSICGWATGVAWAALALLVATTGWRRQALETALVAAAKSIENAADLHHGLLEREQRHALGAAAWVAKSALAVAGFAAALYWTGKLWPALAMAAAAHALVLALVERRSTRSARARANPSVGGSIAELASRAVPLGMVVALISLLANIPRWFVDRRQGPEALGYLAALGCFPLGLQALIGAAAQAATARLAVLSLANRMAFQELAGRLAWLAAGAGGIAVVATPWLAEVAGAVYRPEYASHPALLGWLLVAGALAGVGGILGTAVTAAGHSAGQPGVYAAAAGASALYCHWRVDAQHPTAGAQAMALGAAVVALGQGCLMGRLMACLRRIG